MLIADTLDSMTPESVFQNRRALKGLSHPQLRPREPALDIGARAEGSAEPEESSTAASWSLGPFSLRNSSSMAGPVIW